MPKPRLLSKSRFKIGSECPTKLFFTGKKEYGSTKTENAFLEALAEGGFQVGELAKLYVPGGVEIETLDVEKALSETAALLQREHVIIYEPAIQFQDLLVRVDILVKQGSSIELIEVKAKSIDPSEPDGFYQKSLLKKGIYQLNSEWEPYLLDVAFQTFVAQRANPNWKITPYLMLANKTAIATVDGLNQRFFLEKVDGRTRVSVAKELLTAPLGEAILTKIDVSSEVAVAQNSKFSDRTFEEHVRFLADLWKNEKMAEPCISSGCKSCEFKIGATEIESGLKSGFEECWTFSQGLNPEDFKKPFVFDLWNFRKSNALIEDGRIFLEDVKKSDLSSSRNDEPGLSSAERQWLQIEKTQLGDVSSYVDFDGLSAEFDKLKFPLNFIDFETTMVAIPFNIGLRPYEQIAFQFSHHVVNADGTIEHKNQYLNRIRGKFPNFDFVRALRDALEENKGSIFRYAAHENTVLCQIREQLKRSTESDRDELIAWIESVTRFEDEEGNTWSGNRNMIDLCEFVKRYYYNPKTNGSNSIKKVLPAVLSESKAIQSTYARPIYGAKDGIVSLNFKDWSWIKVLETGAVADPYKLLPPVFSDVDSEYLDSLLAPDSIADGGAAMTAYARMQFTQMTDAECDKVTAALLKYCELDTFAMVLIYQHWKALVAHSEECQTTA